MEELLTSFNAHLDSYTEHREYIARAQAQAEKFSSAIIEKVVLDHEVKSSAVADEVLPLVPEVEGHIATIDAEVTEIESRKGTADEQMEELQLRQLIGELSEEGFESESADLRKELEAANSRLEELSTQRETLQAALDRWVELATAAGQATGVSSADAADEPVVEEDADAGTHSSTDHIQDDVSAVFDHEEAEEAEPVEVAMDDGGETIEAGEDVDFGFDEDEASAGGEEVELNLVDGGAAGEAGAEEIGIDLDAIEGAPAEAEAEVAEDAEDEGGEDEARRALLLYQEGTAEEQIYPFTGEVLTVGRGRDNDIQIKNDSKVSRFHCKLFRRGGNFYIEDNKSSNGTLVNGELITERRLFGGEEVIIGETFFRFRIM